MFWSLAVALISVRPVNSAKLGYPNRVGFLENGEIDEFESAI
jgi:hypothetical protein